MELLIVANVWQKANESIEKAQKRASESAVVSSNTTDNPTIQAWYPIFQENFEGVTPPALPSGWTRVDGNSDGVGWETFPSGTCAGSVSFTSKYACYDDDGAGQNSPATTEILRTPKIYVQGGAIAYRVRFNYSFDAYTPTPVETFYVNLVYWSGNNPPTTVRILNLPGTADSLNKIFQGDITSYITGNNDTIQLEFVYRDAGDWGWGAGIDNVVVEGDYQLSNDLATVGVNVQLTSGGYFFYPPGTSINFSGNIWVKIRNTGTNPQSNIPVYLRVNANNFGPLTISSLNPNQTDSVQFTNISFNAGNNTIKAWHGISDDYLGNDTFNTTYTTPTAKADTILNYPPSLTANDAIGSSGNLGNSHEAVRYDSIAIWPFVVSADSYYITKVFFYHCSTFNPSTCPGGTTRISLWMDDGTGKPNINMEIIGKDTTLPSGTSGAKLWFVGLPNPIKVEQSLLPFYAGRNWNINNVFPFGIDNTSTCLLNYSCWIRADAINNGAWTQLTAYNLNYSWILGIVVQRKATGQEEVILPNDAKLFRSEIIKGGKLELIRPLDKNAKIEIYNLNGQVVRSIELNKGTTIINVGKLSKGVYVYVLDGKVGKIISE